MIAYRAERAMAGQRADHLSRQDDLRARLRRLFATSVNLRPDPQANTLTVEVHRLGSPLQDAAHPLVASADIAIQNDNPAVILLETRNFPIEGAVEVRVAQKWGAAAWQRAVRASGNQTLATWRLTNTMVKGYTTLQARATAP